jgi:hypothetical protein
MLPKSAVDITIVRLALDVLLASLGGQRLLIKVVEERVVEGVPGRDPLRGVIDQHLQYRIR